MGDRFDLGLTEIQRRRIENDDRADERLAARAASRRKRFLTADMESEHPVDVELERFGYLDE